MDSTSSSGRRNWTREELLAAMSLYCQIPFGKMHTSNPSVVALARELGRTPSAIALKLVNFASLDPEHQSRGITGMSHVSSLDREVWADYYGRWDRLAEFALVDNSRDDGTEQESPEAEYEDKTAMVKIRRGQAFFRRSVLSAYCGSCCITGIANPGLLRASHIKPWATDVTQRLNPRNGLTLNALHDAAFDRGLITLDEELRVVLTRGLRSQMPADVFSTAFAQYEGQEIRKPERFAPDKELLAFHREHIFEQVA